MSTEDASLPDPIMERLEDQIAWYDRKSLANQRTFKRVKIVDSWRNSDVVGRFVVFDISHNRCRLIATIKYRWRMVYIRRILGHAEYDEKEWQKS